VIIKFGYFLCIRKSLHISRSTSIKRSVTRAIVADDVEDVSCDLHLRLKNLLNKCIYYFLFLGYLSYNGEDLSDTSHTRKKNEVR
jgi:hypothetical protein